MRVFLLYLFSLKFLFLVLEKIAGLGGPLAPSYEVP